MILGTAGHVDHGKTALVKALTGVDTDRLPEEKRRGMTIELGFAQLVLPDQTSLSVIDVPGHQRFINAMLAGAGGIDCVMVVIACDEGPQPQTYEHLAICELLGVRRGVVVLTKADRLPDLPEVERERVKNQVKSTLSGTFLASARVLEVSARTGQGLVALRDELQRLAHDPTGRERASGPLFMPIDRVFSARGFGLVVAGTLRAGQVSKQSEPFIAPLGVGPLRVRSLETRGASVDRAIAGERVALNLAELSVEQVHRGMALVDSEVAARGARVLDVELRMLKTNGAALPKRSRRSLALGATTLQAVVKLVDLDSLAAGARGFAQLRLSAPVAAMVGQRFVLRDAERTLGGGRVLALDAPRRRAGASARLEALASAEPGVRVSALLVDAGHGGLSELELVVRSGLQGDALAAAVVASQGVQVDAGRVVAREHVASLKTRLLDCLAAAGVDGLARATVRQQLGVAHEKTFEWLVRSLVAEHALVEQGERLRLAGPGRSERSELQRTLLNWLERGQLAPLSVGELAHRMKLGEALVAQQLALLCTEGVAVRAGALYFEARAVMRLRDVLVRWLNEHGQITTAEFKELVGQSRKFAIPLAEYFDRERVTLRVGEVRKLRKGPSMSGPTRE